jgi:hypothetical protein
MAVALLALAVTAAAGVGYAAWRQDTRLRRRRRGLREWARAAGWELASTVEGVPWPLSPPLRGMPQAVVSGRHAGHDGVVVWAATHSGAVTTAYVRLPTRHGPRRLRRRRPTDPTVTVEDGCLAAAYGRWLDPTEVDEAVDAAVAAAGAA